VFKKQFIRAAWAWSRIDTAWLPAAPNFCGIDHLRFVMTVINRMPGAEMFFGSQHFMEAEFSLSYSYQLTTCPYFELYKSSPPHLLPTFLRSIVFPTFHLRIGLAHCFCPSGYTAKTLYAFLFSPEFSISLAVSLSLSLFLINHIKFQYLMSSKNHAPPHDAILFSHLLLRTS
jgi:hypothetical protein